VRAAIAQHGQFGKVPVRNAVPFFTEITASFAAFHKVPAGVLSFEAATVDGRQGHAFFEEFHLAGSHQGLVQQTLHAPPPQQTLRSLLQRGEVRRVPQADRLAQRRRILQKSRDAAIIQLEGFLQNQAGKKLRLRERFGAVAM